MEHTLLLTSLITIMKQKLGAATKLKSLTYSNYTGLLKKELLPLCGSADPLKYILVAGSALTWKQQPKSPTQPLFYVGDLKDWIKWVGAQKLTLKEYSYGTCKLVVEKDTVQVRLLPQKGSLAETPAMTAIAKIFKGVKPKLAFTVVKEWTAAPLAAAKGAPKAKAAAIDPKAAAIDKKFGTPAITSRQNFEQAVEKAQEAAQLDQHLKELFVQIKTWQAAYKKNKQDETPAFKDLSLFVREASTSWKKMRPLYADWQKRQEEINKKGANPARLKALQKAYETLQAFS